MPVSHEMRQVEQELDEAVRKFPVWRRPRNRVLRSLLDYYCGTVEILLLAMIKAREEGAERELLVAQHEERQLRAGVFQALKWTMEFAPDGVPSKPVRWATVAKLIERGRSYEGLVDYLKCAERDLVVIGVDRETRTLTIYEGGDLTGADSQLVYSQRERLPYYWHFPLTEDSHKLTTKWTAGDFRSVLRKMGMLVKSSSDWWYHRGAGEDYPLMPRPRVIVIPDFSDATENAVLDDLTLTPEKLMGRNKWQMSSFFDTPLVRIGKRRFGASDMLLTLAICSHDDHMIRIAARVDPDQYSSVSGLRESRMMSICREKFEAEGWSVETGKRIPGPPRREIDVLASLGATSVLLQLKSTLRPETSWETYKRNEDILEGIRHTAQVANMLPHRPIPFLITDGYRGDYVTWASALRHAVPIGTLRDISEIARDPERTIPSLKSRVGFDSSKPVTPLPDRYLDIMGWRMRIVDAPSPGIRIPS